MKRVLFIALCLLSVAMFADCINCPSGTTAPGAAAAPTTRFHGFTSESNKYDGVAPTCYTPTANTLNGHLQGINNKLCAVKSILDSLRSTNASQTARIDSIIAAMDSSDAGVEVRLDSIITALMQMYNTSIISSDSSISVTLSTNLLTRVNTYNVRVVDDSVAITSANGLSGTGQSYNPVKLGGTLTQNTTIDGDYDIGLNLRKLYISNKYDTISSTVLFSEYSKVMNKASDFVNDDYGNLFSTIREVKNGTWNMSSYQVKPCNTAIYTDLRMTSGATLLKTGDTSAISYGDLQNVDMGFQGQQTVGGHVTSMRNLTLYAPYKGANSVPFTVYRYISLALPDLNPTPNTTFIVPTDRYAIYQEGKTDKVVFMGVFMLPNLPVYASDGAAAADTAFPSGGAYLITGSTVLHIKP